ncbi:MAG: helix-turn-helix domain-containing protein [bacterium]
MSLASSRRRPPPKPERYSPALLIEALTKSRGRIAVAARMLGCSRQTIYDSMKRHAEIKEVIDGERELFVDTAELKLMEAVQKGQPWAIMLVLKTLGRDRGYVERQEHDHRMGGKTLAELICESAAEGEAVRGNGRGNGAKARERVGPRDPQGRA